MLHKAKSIVVALLSAFVSKQWGQDIAKAFQVVLTVMQEAEDKHGAGNGSTKRKEAIDAFMDEVEKPGGLNLPTIVTGDMGRRFIGLLIDGLMALKKHGEKGN